MSASPPQMNDDGDVEKHNESLRNVKASEASDMGERLHHISPMVTRLNEIIFIPKSAASVF